MRINTKNERETQAIGQAIGQECRGGEVLALVGDLGAGKTKLLQGLAKGLGIKTRVNSPTFNILKIYKGNKRTSSVKIFCHIDAYRLKLAKDLINLGVKESLGRPDTVVAIEWAEKVRAIWPKKTIVIKIKHLGEDKREILIK